MYFTMNFLVLAISAVISGTERHCGRFLASAVDLLASATICSKSDNKFASKEVEISRVFFKVVKLHLFLVFISTKVKLDPLLLLLLLKLPNSLEELPVLNSTGFN